MEASDREPPAGDEAKAVIGLLEHTAGALGMTVRFRIGAQPLDQDARGRSLVNKPPLAVQPKGDVPGEHALIEARWLELIWCPGLQEPAKSDQTRIALLSKFTEMEGQKGGVIARGSLVLTPRAYAVLSQRK